MIIESERVRLEKESWERWSFSGFSVRKKENTNGKYMIWMGQCDDWTEKEHNRKEVEWNCSTEEWGKIVGI